MLGVFVVVRLFDLPSGRILCFPDDCRFAVRESDSGGIDVLMVGSENRLVASLDISSLPSLELSCIEDAFRSANECISRLVSEKGSAVCFLPSDVFHYLLDTELMVPGITERSMDVPSGREQGLGV